VEGWNMTNVWRWLVVAACVLVGVSTVRCSNTPAKPDVVAELNKLNLPNLPKTYTPQQIADIEKVWGGPGQYFIQTGCFSCHPVSVYEIKSLAPIAPDLSVAVEDVRSRFGRSLEDFFAEPQGTMQMVFTQLIKLTPEQKATAIAELHKAYDLHEKKEGGAGRD
jgi:hypothetical protein